MSGISRQRGTQSRKPVLAPVAGGYVPEGPFAEMRGTASERARSIAASRASRSRAAAEKQSGPLSGMSLRRIEDSLTPLVGVPRDVG